MTVRWTVGLLAAVAAACSRPSPPAVDPKLEPTHPCTWFTAEELGKRLGVAVDKGQAAGPLGLAGHWIATDDPKVYVQIVVTRDTAFWKVPVAADVTVLHGIGKGAYVQPSADGFVAAGCLDRLFVNVFVGGRVASAALAERLLVDTLSRAR
ncbi:MAG: hypothetical protein JNK15_16210 [Planctomycetes bacterium]|nr:hypothetical protein [Planctomycetota bacterium]